MVSPGASTWPSGSGVLTTYGRAGGAALVTVTARLPVLDTVSVFVADRPTATLPKESDDGVMDSCATPTIAWPVSVMVAVPLALVSLIVEVSAPADVGV